MIHTKKSNSDRTNETEETIRLQIYFQVQWIQEIFILLVRFIVRENWASRRRFACDRMTKSTISLERGRENLKYSEGAPCSIKLIAIEINAFSRFG